MMLQYNELATNLERIRRFLASSSEDRLNADQRRFAYISCISALYSSFENFAERLIFRFGEMILADPANLSTKQMDKMRSRYVRSASVLLGQGLGVGRFRDVTNLDVAKSLASCLDETTPSFDLRLEIIALHNSNLRWETLSELFHWAIPDLHSRIQHSDAVRKWMSLTSNVSDDTLMGALKSELDDLVERRNEVAHRAIPEEIVSHERLLEKVSYVEAIALGLTASLAGLFLETLITKGESILLGVPAERFKKNRIIVFSSLDVSVSEGDCILAAAENSMRWGYVKEIQVNDERVSSAHAGTEAGLFLDFAVQRNAKIYLWPAPNSDFAFSPDGIFGAEGPFDAA